MDMLANLGVDPMERAVDESTEHSTYVGAHLFDVTPETEYVAQWISSFRDVPPRSKPGTFGSGDGVEAMTAPRGPRR
jgi:arylsulfatase